MAICCDNCGKKIEKYCVVRYEIEYIEEYLADYFQIDIGQLRKRNVMNRKWAAIRSICFNIMERFTDFNVYKVGARYGVMPDAVRSSMRVIPDDDHDYRFIIKDLSNSLPEVIKHIYNDSRSV